MKLPSFKGAVASICAAFAFACIVMAGPSTALAEGQMQAADPQGVGAINAIGIQEGGQTQTELSGWTPITNIDPTSGEYGKDYGWRVVSTITVEDGVLSDVVVTGRGVANPNVPEMERPYFEPCHNIMEDRIISAGLSAADPDSVDDIDIVAGATQTSYWIKDATKQALAKWNENNAKAQDVIAVINAIPEAADKEDAVNQARAAYNGFPKASEYVPADVTKILTDAEAAIEKAEKEAAAEANLANGKVILKTTKYTYNGKACRPAVTVKTKSGKTVPSASYSVAYAKNTNAGTATVTVTAKAPYTGKKSATFTIAKAKQKITPAKATYTAKFAQAKKKNVTFAVAFKANGGGKITYAAAKSGTVSIAKNGKVTVKKGTKKKVYTLKVKVTAAAKGNYAKTTQTVNLKVKVA